MISITLNQATRTAVDLASTVAAKIAAINAAHPAGSKMQIVKSGVVVLSGDFISATANGINGFSINYGNLNQTPAQVLTLSSATSKGQTVAPSGAVIMSGFFIIGPTESVPVDGNFWRLNTLNFVSGDFIEASTLTIPASNLINVQIAVQPPAPVVSSPWPTTPTAPASLDLYDWSSGSVIYIGSALLTKAMPDTILEDATLNSDMGSVLARGSSNVVPFGDFEFGGVALYSPTAALGNAPLFEVSCAFKPRNRWASYPAVTNFNPDTDITHPKAFKVKILDTLGNVLHVHEWLAGKPINDRTLSQVRSATNPQYPLFHCGAQLVWRSARTKPRANPERLIPGPKNYRHQTSVQLSYAANDGIGYLSARNIGDQSTGYGFWDALPPLPLGTDLPSGYTATNPYIFLTYTGDDGTPIKNTQIAQGWKYMAGGRGGHTLTTGYGGTRSDRFNLAHLIGRWLDTPTGTRALNNVPLRDMVEHWNDNYFNRCWNWTVDVTTLEAKWSNVAQALNARHMNGYYGGENQTYGPLSETVDLRAPGAGGSRNVFSATGVGSVTITGYATPVGSSNPVITGSMTQTFTAANAPFNTNSNPMYPTFFANRFEITGPAQVAANGSLGVGRGGLTKEGHPFWNGEATDGQHAHQNPYQMVSIFNDPLGLIVSKNAFISAQMTRLGDPHVGYPTAVNSIDGYTYQSAFQRTYAWQIMHYANAWHIGTSQGFGFRRSEILAALTADYLWYKTNVMDVTITQAAAGSIYHQSVLNLGAGAIALIPFEQPTKKCLALDWQPMELYITQIYVFMKTSGLWATLRQNAQVAAVLDWQINRLMKLCVDYRIDANGAAEYQFDIDPTTGAPWTGGGSYIRLSAIKNSVGDFVMSDLASNWAAFYANMAATGLPTNRTFFKTTGTPEYYAASGLRAQFAWAMRDYFPEIAYPRVAQACVLYDQDYADIAARVAAQSTPLAKTQNEFAWGYTGAWKFKAPADTGLVL